MEPDPGQPLEVEGVLNPASGRAPDGHVYLLPRMVAKGNVSRVGLVRIVFDQGTPVDVERQGVVLSPDEGWERGLVSAGVEDPRTTWVEDLGLHLMTYVAFGPMGPRPALAVSKNLREWRRLGPLHFEYQPELDMDLNLFPNKDTVFFPEPVPGPDGRAAYAMLHRPMWDLGWIRPDEGIHLPAGLEDDRPGIWISYASVDDVARDVRALVHQRQHRLVALPAHPFEDLKIGAGPPPIRVEDGWLLIHHGVTGSLAPGFDLQHSVRYSAGAMLLDADDPGRLIGRTAVALLEPETIDERTGTVANVVFPTAIENVDGVRFVFYGMADTRIGVARLDRCR